MIVECTPLPIKTRAKVFHEGIDMHVPSIRRIPPECLSPSVKSHNYLNLVLADLEVRDKGPNAGPFYSIPGGFSARESAATFFWYGTDAC